MAIDERELDEASLVTAAQEGDAGAFAELFRRHYPAVRRVCARRLGNATEADEVAQAAFVRAYERIHQCGGERRFGAWVQVIAYRVGADLRRLQARSMPTLDPVAEDAALGPDSCEEALLQSERAEILRSILAGLPPRQREVIVARDLEGRRPGEIAASLGLSLGAVDSLLLRARRRMASAWQAAAIEHGAATLRVTGASLAATAAFSGPSLSILRAVGGAIDRASIRMATTMGMVPGATTAASRLSGLAVATVMAVSPAAAAVPVLAHFAHLAPALGAADPRPATAPSGVPPVPSTALSAPSPAVQPPPGQPSPALPPVGAPGVGLPPVAPPGAPSPPGGPDAPDPPGASLPPAPAPPSAEAPAPPDSPHSATDTLAPLAPPTGTDPAQTVGAAVPPVSVAAGSPVATVTSVVGATGATSGGTVPSTPSTSPTSPTAAPPPPTGL